MSIERKPFSYWINYLSFEELNNLYIKQNLTYREIIKLYQELTIKIFARLITFYKLKKTSEQIEKL